MGSGHTTNCFCSVVGTEEGEGHLVISVGRETVKVSEVKCMYVEVCGWGGGGDV